MNTSISKEDTSVGIVESPLTETVRQAVLNAKHMTPQLQNAVAQFISYEATPIITLQGDMQHLEEE